MTISYHSIKQTQAQKKIIDLEHEVEQLRLQNKRLKEENHRLAQRKAPHVGLPLSLTFLEYLAKNLPQCIIQAFDVELRYFFVGGSGLELIGATPSHFLGKTLRTLEIADQETPDFFEPIYRAALNGQYKEYVFHTRKAHIYTGVVLPLMNADGDIVGGLVICRESVTSDQAERELLELAVVQERQRIAQELHDVVSQTLFTVNMIADVLPKLWERSPELGQEKLRLMRHNTQLAFTQMRTLLYELRPQSLEDVALPELVKQLVTTMKSRTDMGIDLELKCDDDWFGLPHPVKIALYRIVQEGMNNAIQHAAARNLSILIGCDYQTGVLEMTLKDDGQGFNPDDSFPGHLGLKIMRDRAEKADIFFSIQSEIGGGTRINASWCRPASQN